MFLLTPAISICSSPPHPALVIKATSVFIHLNSEDGEDQGGDARHHRQHRDHVVLGIAPHLTMVFFCFFYGELNLGSKNSTLKSDFSWKYKMKANNLDLVFQLKPRATQCWLGHLHVHGSLTHAFMEVASGPGLLQGIFRHWKSWRLADY